MKRLREWTARVAGLFGQRQKNRELDAEIESHLQLHIDDNLQRGMTPEEARRRAILALGGVEAVKEAYRDQRGVPLLEGLGRDLRHAVRTLAQNPGFTCVIVLILAIGMALAAAAFATVRAYLVRSLPYPDSRRLYHVMYAPPGPYEPRNMSAIDWQALGDVVEDTLQSAGATFYLTDGVSVRATRTLQASPGFMRGLRLQAAPGRVFLPEEYEAGAEGVALISHDLWRSRFASAPNIIGQSFPVTREEGGGATQMLRIVGILPEGFWFGRESSEKVDILTPLRARPRVSQVYTIRLRDGVPPALARERITAEARRVGADFRPGWDGVILESMHDRYMKGVRAPLAGVSIAVAIVLVLACANAAILMLLRAMRRQKELAVRAALGADRRHLLRMLAAETGLICAAALGLGLGLSATALRLLAPEIERQLGKPVPASPSDIPVDSSVALAAGGASLAIAVSLAFIPLLAPWQRRLADALRAHGSSVTDGPFMRRLRNSLIALEVAGSIALLAGCGLMVRSAMNLMSTDLGFRPEQVLRVGVRHPARANLEEADLHRFFTALLDRLPQDASSRVTLMSAFPAFYPANTHAFAAAGAAENPPPAGLSRIGPGYFGVYNAPLRQGREFDRGNQLNSQPVAVVSETLARRLWPNGSAIGQSIRVAEGDMPGAPLGPARVIVGVAGDIRQGYDDADLRDIYIPFLQAPTRFSSVHVRTARPLSFWEESVRAAAAELEPFARVTPAITILSEDRRGAGARFLASMLTGFAAFAALLAILGIYGVTRYAVQQREREIAIRVAIGGSKQTIVRLFLKGGARTLAVGMGLGLLGALAAGRILQNLVYGVQPFDLTTLLSAAGLMALAGLGAIWLPARRAAGRNPMLFLKDA